MFYICTCYLTLSLQLETKAKFNRNVKPIGLAGKGNDTLPKSCFVSGWGITNESSSTLSPVLREVNVTLTEKCLMENRYCSEGVIGPNKVREHEKTKFGQQSCIVYCQWTNTTYCELPGRFWWSIGLWKWRCIWDRVLLLFTTSWPANQYLHQDFWLCCLDQNSFWASWT